MREKRTKIHVMGMERERKFLSSESDDDPERADESSEEDYSQPGSHSNQKEGEPDFSDEWLGEGSQDMLSGVSGMPSHGRQAEDSERGRKRRKGGKHSGKPGHDIDL